jgi:predicted  nucleic acid-binding Zn-ribbon protein
MAKKYDEILDRVQKKTDKVISLYHNEKKKNSDLKSANNELNSEISELKNKISELEKKYDALKFAKSLENVEGDTQEAKKRINKIVREIDSCIALLNK